jgi:hypothetical protein
VKKTLFANAIISLALCFFLSPTNSLAGQASLAWDPPDISADVTGYMIHYGAVSGTYSQGVDVGNTTNYTVSNLIDGQTYYFAVTAYNDGGYQSGYSNEISAIMPPSQYLLLTLTPGTGQGTVSGPGISCGDTCLAVYSPGTVVSLSAAADPGSVLAGWSGGGCSGTGLCTATMNVATTITATFQLNTTGALSVTTKPVSGAIIVDGVFKANGSWNGSISAGSHKISFGAVSGYNRPAGQTVTVNSQQPATVTGTYTKSIRLRYR